MKQRHRKHRRPVRDTKAARRREWSYKMANAHPAVLKAWSEALFGAASSGDELRFGSFEIQIPAPEGLPVGSQVLINPRPGEILAPTRSAP